MEEAKQYSPTKRLPHGFIKKILKKMKDSYPWISRSIIVGENENQSNMKLIRIDGNARSLKNDDRPKKEKFKYMYADTVRNAFN